MAHDSAVSQAQPTDNYTRVHDGAISETERRRLHLQGEIFAPLAAWTFDALGIGPGARVLEVGCGAGQLLAEAAERVRPTGRVVGVERDAGLAAAARERVAPYPWAEVVETPIESYDPGEAGFDAVHCRLVLMHQHEPDAFVARLAALARPGGRVAAQEYDMDGPTGEPYAICHPPFPAFERLTRVAWANAQRQGTDFHAGRKALARFARAGLLDRQVQASTAYLPFTDPRMQAILLMLTRLQGGARLEAAGVMSAAEHAALADEINRAHTDPAFDHVLMRGRTLVATVGTKPA